AEDAARLHVALRKRLRVIPEAADPVFRPREGASQRVKERFGLEDAYLLFVGALDARKDPRSLLAAWATARESRPQVKLVIAGAVEHIRPAAGAQVQLGPDRAGHDLDLREPAGIIAEP